MSESTRASFLVLASSSVVACSSLSRSGSVTFKVCKLTSLIEMHIPTNDCFAILIVSNEYCRDGLWF